MAYTRGSNTVHTRYARKGTPMAMNSGKLHTGVARRGANCVWPYRHSAAPRRTHTLFMCASFAATTLRVDSWQSSAAASEPRGCRAEPASELSDLGSAEAERSLTLELRQPLLPLGCRPSAFRHMLGRGPPVPVLIYSTLFPYLYTPPVYTAISLKCNT